MEDKDHKTEAESRLSFGIRGMTCASCVRIVERQLSRVPGIEFVSVNLATERGFIVADPSVSKDTVALEIQKAGYELSLEAPDEDAAARQFQAARGNLTLALAITLPITLIMILHMAGIHIPAMPWLEAVSAIFLWLWPGRATLRSAGIALAHRHTNMDTLVVMGSAAAWATAWMNGLGVHLLSFGSLATMLPTLHLTGRYIEARLRRRATSAIHRLMALQPDEANLMVEDRIVQVPAESVKPGSRIMVRTGERIPLDGNVIGGRGLVIEAMVTGEPAPVPKQTGDEVISGTVVQSGSLEINVRLVGADTFLARMIRLVEEAQSSKVPIQALADRITLVFIPVVTLLALLSAGGWWAFYSRLIPLLTRMSTFLPWVNPDAGAVSTGVFALVATLVIACPCALGLATPMALTAGSGAAARRGLIIRSGEAIQTTRDLDVLLMDKTGTLTQGLPRVVDSDLTPAMIGVAAALEAQSLHPLAEAVVKYAEKMRISIPKNILETHETPGMGIQGEVNGKPYQLGRPRTLKRYEKWTAAGHSIMELSVEGRVLGGLAAADTLREDSAAAVARFQSEGIQVIMLTGDNEAAARVVAGAANIPDFRAGMSPDDKVKTVLRFQGEGRTVGMIGDGLNDAAALKTADVGIAVGSGTDLAMDSADMVIVQGGLSRVADAIDISRITFSTIRQNLFWAFLYNVVAIPMAMFALLHPLIAEAAMFASSANVVLNASRIAARVKRRISG